MFENKLDSIKINFVKYLDSLGISPKSHKNYRSDLNHFSGWAILKIRSFGSYAETLSDAIPFISKALVVGYRTYMAENKIPFKTINRRLSTLRHLAKFLVIENLIDSNFMEGIENINMGVAAKVSHDALVTEYKHFLEAENVSKSTVKNYLSDVNQFLAWLENVQIEDPGMN